MRREINKNILRLHKLGLIKPFVKFSKSVRQKILHSVGYNIGLLPGQLVCIDLMTDSLMHFVLPQRDFVNKSNVESSYLSLCETFSKFFGYKYVLPIAQGRMAEALLAKLMVRNAMVVPSNALFVTTRLHQELNGATVLEIPVEEAYDFNSGFPFKGNLDTKKLENIILEYGADWIPYIYVETCVNATGGHPVSMENIKEVSRIAKANKIPVILDACRILENAYLIKTREKGYSHKSVAEIVKDLCSFTDGCTMSATKDFFVESGGFIATNNEELFYQAQDAIMAFGDGLSITEKAVLNEVLGETFRKEKLIEERVKKVYYLWNKLKKFGLPIVNPSGGHAVFLDTNDLYKTTPVEFHPEKAFLAHLYLSSGIRAGENILTPYQKGKGVKIIRLALPTRIYSRIDMDCVAKSIYSVWKRKDKIQGLKKVYQPPSLSGSFFAEYEMVEKDNQT